MQNISTLSARRKQSNCHLHTKEARLRAWLLSYPRAESNRNRQNRNLKFYPLNYGGRYCSAKILFFFDIFVIFAK